MKLVWRFATLIFVSGCFVAVHAAKGGGRSNKNGEEPFLVVTGIVPGSVAAQLKIHEGDILRAYNGNGVQSIEELEAAKNMAVDSVEVIIDRGEENLSFMFPAGPMGLYLEQRLPELTYSSDAVMLQGIGPLKENDGMNNSYILSLTRASNFLKDNLDYTMLMGLSGAAFRFQISRDWSMMATQASEGYRCDLAALKALGYEYKNLELEKTENNRESMRQSILQTIDAGSPVLGFGMTMYPDWGIITGYQRGGREFIARTYRSLREGYTLAEAFPRKVCLIEGRTVPPTRREAIVRSFAIAEEVLDTEKVSDYYCGMAGINFWLQTLETGKFQDIPQEDFDTIVLTNYTMFTQLIEDRSFAATYLERIAPEFPDVQAKLISISKLYKTEVEYLTAACDEDSCIPYPQEMTSQFDWTPEKRRSQINYLRFARVQEDEALKLWREINAIHNPKPIEGEVPGQDTMPQTPVVQPEVQDTTPKEPVTPPPTEQPPSGRLPRGAQ